jgi:signal transduction histidine kinase
VEDRAQALSEANARLQREIVMRQSVNESLRQREEELRSLLDNSPDMILKTDPHMKIVWANRVSLEMNPGCIGMTCYRAFPGRDEVCEGCPVALALQTKRIERGVMYQPVSETAPDEQYWENIGVPQFDDRGEVIGCIEISRNITDRMQITKRLEAVNEELEAFAYTVSHDLRTPLRHMEGYLGLLQKRAGRDLDQESRGYMESVAEAAKNMESLIDALLSFSRMGRNALTMSPVDLADLVREVIGELKPDIAGRQITWQIGDLPIAHGDTAMLHLVLSNLIANALKFTRVRSVACIEIGSLPGKEGETVIYVRDNGVGFDMAYADKLFGVFQRLHRSEEFEGTGIGLANVHRIITRHGGRVWARGDLDKGAVFYFTLPRHIGGEGDDKTQEHSTGRG